MAFALWETGPSRRAVYHTESNSDGAFEFRAVAEGEWRLHAESENRDMILVADEWIVVTGRDLEGVTARLAAPFTLNGRVMLETPEGAPAVRPPNVVLVRQHDGRMLFDDQALFTGEPDAGGRFHVDGLYPGVYMVQPDEPPPGYYLDAIQNGQTRGWDELELAAGSAELVLIYKSYGGRLRGTVGNCGSGQVLLVAQDAPRFARAVDCDAWGHFQMDAIRPGEYSAVAVRGPDLGPRRVDAVLLQAASRVTIRAGETTQLDLTVSSVR